jgi:hypothetical protein
MARSSQQSSITRIDHPTKRMHGFLVRVVFAGKTQSQIFRDRVYGSRESAFLAALGWCQQIQKR